jgi:hypothetical protein
MLEKLHAFLRKVKGDFLQYQFHTLNIITRSGYLRRDINGRTRYETERADRTATEDANENK